MKNVIQKYNVVISVSLAILAVTSILILGFVTFTEEAGAVTVLTAPQGGTGFGSYTPGDMLYASDSLRFAKIASSTDGFVLAMSNGIPTWVSTTTSLTFADNDYVDVISSGALRTFNGTTSPFFGTLYATGTVKFSTLTTGLVISDTPGGELFNYGGTVCTNQFIRTLNESGVATCATVDISSHTNLAVAANGLLSLSGDTLTASSSPTFGALYATSSVIKLNGVGSSVALALDSNGFLIASSTLTVQSLTATSTLKIPYSTDPTINSGGLLAINTTQASSSLRFYDGTAERVLNAIRSFVVIIGHEGQSGTTTKILMNHERPLTLTRIFCKTSGIGTTTMVFSDGSNDTEYILCHRLGATDDGSITNGSFIAREDMQLRIGSILGSPATTTITSSVREDAD